MDLEAAQLMGLDFVCLDVLNAELMAVAFVVPDSAGLVLDFVGVEC